MIITFSVSNFRSFHEEQTFSMVASNRFAGSHDNHLVPIQGSDVKALRAGVLYGANGAGKSNFFKALAYLRSIALKGRKKGSGTGRVSFRFADKSEPTTLDLQFVVKDQLYRYGVVLDDDRVVEEWLLKVNGGREKVLYERTTDATGDLTIEGKGLKDAGKKVNALATVGGPKDQTFLATIRANLESQDIGETLNEIIAFFESGLHFVQPDARFWSLGHKLSKDGSFLKFAAKFMRGASTGMQDLKVSKEEISDEQLKAMLPGQLFEQITKKTAEEESTIIHLGDDREVLIEQGKDHRFHLLSIQSVHHGSDNHAADFDFAEESDGTRRLLNLLPALHRLHTEGGVFIIDEVERSMHPLLIVKFMEFFFSGCAGKQRQLIITTHESNLLNQNLLRRDEVWFAEKGKEGATTLYSLAEYQPRKDLKLDKHYLQGRFGAVPFLADLEQLFQEEAEIENQ